MRRSFLALLLILVLSSCGGKGPSEEELAQFCKAYDRISDVLGSDDHDLTTLDGLEARMKELEDVGEELEATAPDEIKDDVAVTARFTSLSEDEQYKPSERRKRDEAFEKIDDYADDKCELD